MNFYDSIENLPLYNFDKYRNTKDLNWFIEKYDGRQKKEDEELLKPIENKILDEYFLAIDDRSFTNRLNKWKQIDDLQTKYTIIKALISRMWLGFADNQMSIRLSFVQELAKHGRGFQISEINTIDGDALDLIRVNNAVEGLKTKIHVIEKELLKDAKTDSVSLTKQLQIATLGLQYPYRLNPKELTVIEWIEITKLLEEKSKQN